MKTIIKVMDKVSGQSFDPSVFEGSRAELEAKLKSLEVAGGAEGDVVALKKQV